VWDSLPREPNLSGEWADDPTPDGLALEIVGEQIEQEWPENGELTDELADAWLEGVTATFTDACASALQGAVKWIETEYGDALFARRCRRVRASREQTYEWARRWPCSALRGKKIQASFTGTDLTDADTPRDVLAEEFNAWSDDVLLAAARKVGLTYDTKELTVR
jgi:hypothetical protein